MLDLQESQLPQQIFLFSLETKEVFGVVSNQVEEVFSAREITECSRGQDFISGMISVRGDVLPVVDIRKLVGDSGSSRLSSMLTLETSEGNRFVIQIYQVLGVETHSKFVQFRDNSIIPYVCMNGNALRSIVDVDRLYRRILGKHE